MLPKKIAFVDVETTGARWSDRIIEIGIVRVEENKVVRTYETLINPGCYVPEEILTLTGINPAELENSPSFGQIKREILEILDDSVFVAHNVRFDYSFIRNEFKREEITFKHKHFCTVKLSRALFPELPRHNLDSIIECFGFKCQRRHRALDDAKVLYQFWEHIQKKFSQEEILLSLNKALKRPAIPIKISQDDLDNLPEAPGVYIFYGENGMPLYVGKSVNIRDRILSHFSSDHLSSTEMRISQQIQSIETIITAGELGALIKEASLIKQMQPLYNRKLRHSRLMTVLKSKQTEDGYLTIEMDTAGNIDINQLDSVLGVFRNKKSCKDFLVSIAKEYELCERLLGVDTTLKSCFGYRLGRCKGACLGKEKFPKYNIRFIEAFSKTKIVPWPFDGPAVIMEKNSDADLQEGFVIDKWCYLGSIKGAASDSLEKLEKDLCFDLDTYKILLQYLASGKTLKNVKLLKSGSFYPRKTPHVAGILEN